MQNTVKLGKIIAAYLLVTGIGFLVSANYYSQLITHQGTDPVLINLSGMVHFFIGITIIVHHFVWKNLLQIMVSSLGILFLLKGIFLIAIPELTLQTGNNPAQIPWLMSFGFLGIGLLMGYLSFFNRTKA